MKMIPLGFEPRTPAFPKSPLTRKEGKYGSNEPYSYKSGALTN